MPIPARLVTGVLLLSAPARAEKPPALPSAARPAPARPATAGRPDPAAWRARNALFFQRNWGIDIIGVRPVASGMMLRFDYRVVDPARAAVLGDKKARPYVIDEATNTTLAVPAMEKIGELRQTGALVVGRTYFILFGNPGALVKPGGRVTLVAGNLRAAGMVVE